MKYQEIVEKATKKLEACHIENAKGDAMSLLYSLTEFDATGYLMHKEEVVPKETEEQYIELVSKRANHIPLQYITGIQNFMGLDFIVSPEVLIPRYDTEILVEQVLNLCKDEDKVHDMCTGSGCIITALKYYKPGIVASGSDISTESILVAKQNAENNKVDVAFTVSDLFEKIDGKYDIIVSNPPYIESKVIEGLSEEVRLYEPMRALDGKEDGLFFYRLIIEQSLEHLNQNGYLCFEIGYNQGESVPEILREWGYHSINVKKDLAGLSRVVIARKG